MGCGLSHSSFVYLWACLSVCLWDVTEQVVTSLVEMYLVVGDGLLPHLAALRPHQLKLITAYVEKHRREQPRKQQQEQRRRQQQQQQQTYEEHKPSGQ